MIGFIVAFLEERKRAVRSLNRELDGCFRPIADGRCSNLPIKKSERFAPYSQRLT